MECIAVGLTDPALLSIGHVGMGFAKYLVLPKVSASIYLFRFNLSIKKKVEAVGPRPTFHSEGTRLLAIGACICLEQI